MMRITSVFASANGIDAWDVLHVHDDAAFVCRIVEAQKPMYLPADARLVFLGGSALVATFVKHAAKMKTFRAQIARTFDSIRSPHTSELLKRVGR